MTSMRGVSECMRGHQAERMWYKMGMLRQRLKKCLSFSAFDPLTSKNIAKLEATQAKAKLMLL